MTREEARERFSAAYDAELPAAERAAFDAALAADEKLAAEYAAFRGMLDAARRDIAEGPDVPDLLSGVQRRLRAKSRGRFYADKFAERAGVGLWNPLTLAVAMGVLLLLAWFLVEYMQGIDLRKL